MKRKNNQRKKKAVSRVTQLRKPTIKIEKNRKAIKNRTKSSRTSYHTGKPLHVLMHQTKPVIGQPGRRGKDGRRNQNPLLADALAFFFSFFPILCCFHGSRRRKGFFRTGGFFFLQRKNIILIYIYADFRAFN